MEINVEDVYLRVSPHELQRLEIETKGAVTIFRLKWLDALLRIKRVRVAGVVDRIEEAGSRVDCVIRDEAGIALLRAWDPDAETLRSLEPMSPVEAFGNLRFYQGVVYVYPIFVKMVSPEHIKKYDEFIGRDRALILKIRGGGGARQG